MQAVFPGGLVHHPPPDPFKPPPGKPGVAVPNPTSINPKGVIYYPPQAYNPYTNKVAIISDDTCEDDEFCWVPKLQHHTGVGGYVKLAEALNQYQDGSIDLLIISGNNSRQDGNLCSCRTKNPKVNLGGTNMEPWVYELIKRKLSARGEVIIAACYSGEFGPHVQKTANKFRVPVTGGTLATRGMSPGPKAGGGSCDGPWRRLKPEDKPPME
jgi:hypothetical protein